MPDDTSLVAKNVSSLSARLERLSYSEVIRPGFLIEIDPIDPSYGDYVKPGQSRLHNSLCRRASYFALEKRYKGASIDDYYEIGEKVYFLSAMPGDLVLAWVNRLYSDVHGVLCGEPLYTSFVDPGALTVANTDTGVRPFPPVAVALENLPLLPEMRRILVEVC